MTGIGTRRQRVTWQTKIRIDKPGAGGESQYVDVLSRRVEMLPIRYNRDEVADQIQGRMHKRFKQRQEEAFTPNKSMAIVYNGRQYIPTSIEPLDERTRYWIIEMEAYE